MTYRIAVRSLCDLTAKAGDLDLRFTPAPSAREGVEGHAALARRRGPGYETEIALESEYGELKVRGRADGYDAQSNRLEEFKTHRGDLRHVPASHRAVHWAQLKIYGALLCRARGLKELQLALVYFDIASEAETVCLETHSAQQLERHFTDHCERFLGWARLELRRRAARDARLGTLRFPFSALHPRQRELAEAVYRVARGGRTLLTQAPTGIGKTLATLFPALKAMPAEALDKVFFLVAKTSGRRVALEALMRLQEAQSEESAPLRVLELVAREKACEYPDAECHGESCPLARGFYDRLPAARSEAAGVAIQDRAAVRAIARRHTLCPYYLSQELARWADVVVADYNYYFDQSALLYGLTVANQWKVAVLVDEAHNLVERARGMFSTRLDRATLVAAQRRAPAAIKPSVTKVLRLWDELCGEQQEPYRVYDEIPVQLLRALEGSAASVADFLAQSPLGVADELLDFYFRALQVCRLGTQLDRSTICDVEIESQALCLRNAIPAGFLAPRWAAAHCCVLFSATLTPFDFYRDILGLPRDCVRTEVGSPFAPEQLTVRIVSSISTRFHHRGRSIEPLAELIARQYRAQPGNYLAFLSSFEYLEAVATQLSRRDGAIPIWRQGPGMTEGQREEFLARFAEHSCGIGFAVLGGAFAEGIDLPGRRLIGAFVATLGLPQLNPVNGEIRGRLEERFGAGYEYTYLYPGLRKVVQAAGRVIRGSEDRGVVYLIDDRFARHEVRRLLPRWWRLC